MKARLPRLSFFVLGCSLFAGAAHAQSILQILNALQERQKAVIQLNYAQSNGHPNATAIVWGEGLNSSNPQASDIDALSLQSQIALLNDAAGEYSTIAIAYRALPSVSGSIPIAGWNPANISPVNTESIGTITTDNYRTKLPLLAAKINELKYLPAVFKVVNQSHGCPAGTSFHRAG